MTTYTAHLSHHSIGNTPVHDLCATTLTAAKREARALLGGGFRGHQIVLSTRRYGYEYIQPVAVATIGQPGWDALL